VQEFSRPNGQTLGREDFMHGRSYLVIFALILAGLVVSPAKVHAADPESAPAVRAMTAWLQTIDAGRYGETWDEASSGFKGAVTRERWIDAMKGVRKPLGDVTSRKLNSADFQRSLPGAPDGEYFVIQFHSSFSKKAEAVETVTTVKEGSAWKPAGYFIH
jgi:hypothetical protein